MAEKTVTLLGGDKRELQLLPALKTAGFTVHIFGLPQEQLPKGVISHTTIADAVRDASLIVLPLPGIRNNGLLHAPLGEDIQVHESDMAGIPAGTPVLVGVASAYLKQLAQKFDWQLVETSDLDALARPNAIPTAEAAIQLTMEQMPITIDGMRAMVIGYGRVGEALAMRLRALGAHVTVLNHGSRRFAEAAREGFSIYPWDNMIDVLPQMQVIYNTAPARVLDKQMLMAVNKEAFIMDLASLPGGVDFPAAEALGITTMHALSLPGKYSPVTAGKVLAAVYPRLLTELWQQRQAQQTAEKEGAVCDLQV